MNVSTEQYIPGVILDPEKKRILGHCRDVLPEVPEDLWTYRHSQASMSYGTIEADRKLRAGGRLPGLLSLSGALLRDIRVQTSILEVRGAYLDINQFILQPMLNELRREDRRGRWQQVKNRYVVMETFYASRFEVRFYKNKELLSRLQLEELYEVHIEGELEHQWVADEALLVTDNQKVPFGVRGFIV